MNLLLNLKNLIEKLTNNKRELIITKPQNLILCYKRRSFKDYQNKNIALFMMMLIGLIMRK